MAPPQTPPLKQPASKRSSSNRTRRQPPPRRGQRRWVRLLVRASRTLDQLRQTLTSQWLVSLAGALSACLALWFLGPLLSLGGYQPFESAESRFQGVLGLMVAWGLFNQMRQVRDARADRRLIRALITATGGHSAAQPASIPPLRLPQRLLDHPIPAEAEDADDNHNGGGSAEIESLRRRLAEALALYSHRLGAASLRRLPWYLVIGAPGAGKTTAIAQSGLRFPLSDVLGHRPIQGVAGTRTCDWWFTSEAVLVDTAGRYTTQDSERLADSAAWLGLLDLLKRHRPIQPVNGLVVTVSLADLVSQNPQERQGIADSLNQRLIEIDERLGIRLPVYLLLTKADRLAGFSAFFAGLSADERRQVWGLTFALPPPATDAPASPFCHFADLFESLISRLDSGVPERLEQETDPDLRAQIVSFPRQMAALQTPLIEFMAQAFRPSKPEPFAASHHRRTPSNLGLDPLSPLSDAERVQTRPQTSDVSVSRLIGMTPRGVYLSSAKREGAPIDLLAADRLAAFGTDSPLSWADSLAHPAPRSNPSDSDGHSNGFFLDRLFGEVVFTEAHLAGNAPRSPGNQWVGRFAQRRWAILAVLAGSLTLAGLWGHAWFARYQGLATLETHLETAKASLPDDLGGGPRRDRVDDDQAALPLPALEALSALKTAAASIHAAPIPWTIPLDQGDQAFPQAEALFHRALNRLLLPRLMIRLDRVLAGTASGTIPSDRLYDGLKVYLMMTGQAPLDRYAVTQWFTLDWIATLPGSDHEQDRRRLAAFLAILLDSGLPTDSITASSSVIAEARRRLAGYPLAERATALMRAAPELRTLPGWHLADHAGSAAAQVLTRRSGQAWSEPISGLYTRDGCLRAVLPAIAQAASDVARESWVLGLPTDPQAVAALTQRLRQDMISHYFEDYAHQWRDLLNDLTLAPTGTLRELLPVLAAASGPGSPLSALIAAVAVETDFPPPPASPPPPIPKNPAKTGPTTPGMLGLTSGATVVTAIQPLAGGGDPGWWAPAATDLSRRFAIIRALTLSSTASPGPTTMTAAVASLRDLRRTLTHWAATNAERNAGMDVRRAADRVKDQAETLPAPVSGWIAGLGEAANRALLLGPEGPPPKGSPP